MAGQSVRRTAAGGADTSVIDNWRHSERLTTVWDKGVKNPVIAMLYGLIVFNTDNRKMYRHMAEVGRVAPGTSVLDIPSGGGVVLRALRPRHRVRYVAADISPLMLAKVREEAYRRELRFVETREADAGALPFDDGSFDIVVSYSGLHCVPDPQLALKEMARVLRSGGRLRGSVVVRGVNRVTDTFINVWVRRRILDVVDTEQALLGWLADAGFTSLITHRSGAVVYFDGVKPA